MATLGFGVVLLRVVDFPYGILDQGGRGAPGLSSAGMPPVYVYRNKTRELEEIMLKGMPLGAMKHFPYVVHQMGLQAGDTMLLLTDGLPEQKNARGEMFDYARVQDKFKEVGNCSPGEIVQHLVKYGEEWMDGAAQDDDITLLVIRMKGENSGGNTE